MRQLKLALEALITIFQLPKLIKLPLLGVALLWLIVTPHHFTFISHALPDGSVVLRFVSLLQ